MKGGLFYVEKWELRVVLSHNHDKLRAIAHIDRLEYFGNEGEAMIGDPRDFISYGAVEETLNDPTRQAYSSLLFGTHVESTSAIRRKAIKVSKL